MAGWDETPIDISGLRAIDADLRLSARELIFRDVEAGQSALAVTLRDGVLTRDAHDVVVDPDIDVVVEVIGGIEPARELITAALTAASIALRLRSIRRMPACTKLNPLPSSFRGRRATCWPSPCPPR